VYQACLLGKITYNPKEGTQSALDRIATTPEFKKIFKSEIGRRGLRQLDILPCLATVYHDLSKHANGNDGFITLRTKDRSKDEHAALAIFLKVQEKWIGGLKWREV